MTCTGYKHDMWGTWCSSLAVQGKKVFSRKSKNKTILREWKLANPTVMVCEHLEHRRWGWVCVWGRLQILDCFMLLQCHVWVHCFFCSSDGTCDKQVVELTLRRRCSQRYLTYPSAKISNRWTAHRWCWAGNRPVNLSWEDDQLHNAFGVCGLCVYYRSALLLLTLPAGTKPRTSRQQSPGGERRRKRTCPAANSKHWLTTSFLQPQPYLVTP